MSSGSGYEDGFRDGALAERQRCILIALRAVNKSGTPSDVGHNIAHDISDAGEVLPVLVGPPPYGYGSFGERRIRAVPTAMESVWGPFTEAGHKYLKYLETKLEILAQRLGPAGYLYATRRVVDVQVLERCLRKVTEEHRKLTEEHEELLELVEILKAQSSGVIR